MENKIFELILTSFKNRFREFSTISLLDKLEFILEILETYESYTTKMFHLKRSPLIDTSNSQKHYIAEIKKTVNKFLLEISGSSEQSVPINLICFSKILLGIAYEYGIFDFPEDHKMAFGLYETVSRVETEYQYNSLALLREAMCFEKGIGTRIKKHKAIEYYRLSAKLGDKKALHVYGSIVFYGFLNQKPNYAEASFYLKQAVLKATETYPYAYFDLGVLYESSNEFRDIKYAVECYKKGADLNCQNCSFKLARSYEIGDLQLQKDRSKSIFYYKLSKHANAYLQLAQYYFKGDFMSRNDIEGYKLALKATVNGNLEGLELLGNLCEKGIGVKKNLSHSLWWYEIALSHGLNVKEKVKRLRNMMAMKFKSV